MAERRNSDFSAARTESRNPLRVPSPPGGPLASPLPPPPSIGSVSFPLVNMHGITLYGKNEAGRALANFYTHACLRFTSIEFYLTARGPFERTRARALFFQSKRAPDFFADVRERVLSQIARERALVSESFA